MKRLLLAALLLMTLFTSAQAPEVDLRSEFVSITWWNAYKNTFDPTPDPIDCSVHFKLKNGYIYSTDKRNSWYHSDKLLYDKSYPGHLDASWEGTDDTGETVMILMQGDSDEKYSHIYIYYYHKYFLHYYTVRL